MPTKAQGATPRRGSPVTPAGSRRWRLTDTRSVIADLVGRIEAARPTQVGADAASDYVDFTSLTHLLCGQLLANVGDPWDDSDHPQHTKDVERDVVAILADLLRAPADDRWGYVTTGAAEGTLYALHLARRLYPDAVVYHSCAAHDSVSRAVRILGMESIVVGTDSSGEIDYSELADQARRHRHRPVVIVATVGTAMTGAVDNVHRIFTILKACGIADRYIHADAAVSGVPLALLEPAARPGFDFADGADSVTVSGHTFIGVPIPCGVVIVKESLRTAAHGVADAGGVGAPIIGFRNGYAPLLLWLALDRHGAEGLRLRAEAARELAAYTQTRLARLGWEAYRNPYSMTVVFKTPPAAVADRWNLHSEDGWSRIICMPGAKRSQIEKFISELRDSLRPQEAGADPDLPKRIARDPTRPAIPTTAEPSEI